MESKFLSLTYICGRLQTPPGQVESAMRDLKIQPALELDRDQFFTVADETAIDGELRRRAIERIKRQGK